MSEHTQGKLIAKYEWLVPEAHQNRPIGNSSNPIHDRDNYAQVVAQVRGRYHDQDANARRLAAAWNAFDGVSPPLVEFIADHGGVKLILGESSKMESELNAARALLREVSKDGSLDMGNTNSSALGNSVRAYLDACDKPGAPNAS